MSLDQRTGRRRWRSVPGESGRPLGGLRWASSPWHWGPVVAAAAFSLHCSELSRPESCGLIPGDGCPLDSGGTCDDRSCDALYACEGGQWQLVETCPPRGGGGAGGGAGAGGTAQAGGTSGGAGGCAPASIDHSGEQGDCDPDLVQTPDCPVQAAESCHPCLTGCADFFLCLAEGWELVAYCTDEGELVVVQ